MNNFLFRGMFFLTILVASVCQAQKTKRYNLSKLLDDNRLVIFPNQDVITLSNGAMLGVSANGIVWLRDVTFSTGSIDVDLKGKDVFQQSFLGIAFHGADTANYDAIYFRPFNFQSDDTLRRKHMVQYISQPDYPWERLRKEHPLMYEDTVTPSLVPSDWFHARIVVNEHEIIVYVNHPTVPTLKVKKLNTRNDGLIGLWNFGLNGDFANLEITSDK